MDSHLVYMMAHIQDHQKGRIKELHFVLYSSTQLVKFLNSFCCTIVLGGIQRFIMFLSRLLNIQTGIALQGCQFYNCFVHVFLKIKHFVLLQFLIQFYIIILLQCTIKLSFKFSAQPFNALLWIEMFLIALSSIYYLIPSPLVYIFKYA